MKVNTGLCINDPAFILQINRQRMTKFLKSPAALDMLRPSLKTKSRSHNLDFQLGSSVYKISSQLLSRLWHQNACLRVGFRHFAHHVWYFTRVQVEISSLSCFPISTRSELIINCLAWSLSTLNWCRTSVRSQANHLSHARPILNKDI